MHSDPSPRFEGLAPQAIATVLAAIVTGLVAALFVGSGYDAAMAWATVPVAALAGWCLAAVPLNSDRLRGILSGGFAFGASVALGGVLLFILATMVAALLPGSTVARPEGPLGYVIVLVLILVTMTPIVAVPASLVGLVWAIAVRRLVGRPQAV